MSYIQDNETFDNMKRVNKIIENNEFISANKSIKIYEKNRAFCKHNLKHFLDVARISYILNLEKQLGINKEIIYAAALLHDIGRFKQYEDKTPHEIASGSIAENILRTCEFQEEEIKTIVEAIIRHRSEPKELIDLESVIYAADKLSRNCFSCKAENKCNWSKQKKNYIIRY